MRMPPGLAQFEKKRSSLRGYNARAVQPSTMEDPNLISYPPDSCGYSFIDDHVVQLKEFSVLFSFHKMKAPRAPRVLCAERGLFPLSALCLNGSALIGGIDPLVSNN